MEFDGEGASRLHRKVFLARLIKMADAATMEGGKKRNTWLSHVKKTMKAHKGKSFKAVLKMAKKTYKGGAEPASEHSAATTAAPVGGRRRTRKTRRGGRKH